jgi:hypothetical protein
VWLLKIGLCPKNKSHPLGGWIFTAFMQLGFYVIMMFSCCPLIAC